MTTPTPPTPTRPPITRAGRTHTIRVGPIIAEITVNRDAAGNILEVFARADGGMQGHLDNVCRAYSLGFQGRCDVPTAIRHLRGDRTEPCGIAGQPASIYDALGRVLEEEMGRDDNDQTTKGPTP